MDDIIAGFTLEHSGFARWRTDLCQDVVTCATVEVVNALAGLDPVIATEAPQCVITIAADDRIVLLGSGNHHMVIAIVAQVVRTTLDHRRHRFEKGLPCTGSGVPRAACCAGST